MRLRAPLILLALSACEPAPDPDYRGRDVRPVEQMAVDTAAADSAALDSVFAAIERETGGQLGVTATVVESGRTVSYRGGERFPMASTFKVAVAMAVLARVDSGRISLDDSIRLTPADYRMAPSVVTEDLPAGGGPVTVRRLVESMVRFSDNTATDVLMQHIGGPGWVMAHLQSRGVQGIRVDRYEGQVYLEYNGVRRPPAEWTLERARRLVDSVPPAERQAARERFFADPRDTATPDGWAQLLIQLQRGDGISPAGRELILDAMRTSPTGTRRIRAGVPRGTEVADKTGTIGRTTNDVGIVTLPDGTHVALAVFVRNSPKSNEQVEPSIAAVARAVYEHFAGTGAGGPPADSTARRRE